MANHLPLALAVIRQTGRLMVPPTVMRIGNHTGKVALKTNFGWNHFRSDLLFVGESKRMISSHPLSIRFFCHSTTVNCQFTNTTCTKRKLLTINRQWVQNLQEQDLGKLALIPINRPFTTSSINWDRYNKESFEASDRGASRYSKRRRSSSIGQLSNNSHPFDFINDKRTRFKIKEAKLKISKGVKSIRSDLHKRLRENLQDQRAKKNVLVRNFKRQVVTKTKKENIKTIPNLLTTLRMASAPLLSYLVISDHYGWALSIFVLAGFTDLLDGYVARNFKNQRTAFGTALDPLADKFLISFLTVSLTVNGLIPVPLTVLILGRDAGLVVASFYIRYISLSPPRTLARYFDFSHVTAKIYPSNISKINTAIQLSFVACTLAAPVFDFVESPWLQLLMYTTAATTFLSGADYVLTWRRRLKIIKNT